MVAKWSASSFSLDVKLGDCNLLILLTITGPKGEPNLEAAYEKSLLEIFYLKDAALWSSLWWTDVGFEINDDLESTRWERSRSDYPHRKRLCLS